MDILFDLWQNRKEKFGLFSEYILRNRTERWPNWEAQTIYFHLLRIDGLNFIQPNDEGLMYSQKIIV